MIYSYNLLLLCVGKLLSFYLFHLCRNESTQTRKSPSNSRSPSPARPLSDSQRDELVTLRQKCEDLEKKLQEERK